MGHSVANWLVDLGHSRRTHWPRRDVQTRVANLARRLYIVSVAWCGVRAAQRQGIDVVAVGVMRGAVQVWDRSQPTGEGTTIRLESGGR